MSDIETIHLMAGGGGDLSGFAEAGCTPIAALNHRKAAVDTVTKNHPWVRGYVQDVASADMSLLPRAVVACGSPICKDAAPSAHRSTGSQAQRPWTATRATAWSLVSYAEAHRPLVVCGENVIPFWRWELLDVWMAAFAKLGYPNVSLATIDAAHVGGPGNPTAPQKRGRLLFAFSRKGIKVDLSTTPESICREHGPVAGVRVWRNGVTLVADQPIGNYGSAYRYECPVSRCGRQVEPVTRPMRPGIEWSVRGTYVRDGRPRDGRPYVPRTRARIQAGLDALGGEPFVAILRNHSTWESLDGPTSTITAEGNHHMLVRPGPCGTVDGCEVRMWTTREKAHAQRFREGYEFAPEITKTGKLRDVGGVLTGNAVPVNVGHLLGQRVSAGIGGLAIAA